MYDTPALSDESTLERTIDCLIEYLLLEISGYFISRLRPGRQVVFQNLFPLKTMLEFLAHAVERRFSVITAIYLPVSD